MSFFKQDWLKQFAALEYDSKSHSFNKAVIASYYNVAKYGFVATDDCISINQSKRTVHFLLNGEKALHQGTLLGTSEGGKQPVFLCEDPIFKNKEKEVCYDLHQLFVNRENISATSRGIKFRERDDVEIVDYCKDARLDLIYDGWKRTKEENPKTFLMTFNPARYYRSYKLLDHGFDIYQKLVLIKKQPYALINFAIDGWRAYELSFLSLYKQQDLKLINDQNDCIIINCLYDMFTKRGINAVNLGTSAGIKGLKFFKTKLPHFAQIVYRQ